MSVKLQKSTGMRTRAGHGSDHINARMFTKQTLVSSPVKNGKLPKNSNPFLMRVFSQNGSV